MKLFCVGPVEMADDILKIGSRKLPYFRTQEFSQLLLDTEYMLKKLLGAGENSNVAILTASGTGAMEAAVINVFNKKDKVLVIDGGSFGRRFAQICNIHNIPCEVLKLDFGERLTYEHLEKYDKKGFTGMLVNLHETSTGQLYDIKMLSRFCKDNNMFLIVDAISTFLADSFDMEDYGIDLTIISSQKGLALYPGLSIICANSRIIEEKISCNSPPTLYFRLADYFENMERGQTPYTPAQGIIYQLNAKLKQIYETGVDVYIKRCKNLANDFRFRIKEIPVLIPSYPLSNALTPIILKNRNAYELFLQLKEKYNIIVTPSGGELRNILLRIGHIGELTVDDNKMLIEILKKEL